MNIWRRFFAVSTCTLGCGLRDAEAHGTYADLWLGSRSPSEIIDVARFAHARRLPISRWIARIDEVHTDDAKFLVELARYAKTLEVRCPRTQSAGLTASIRSTRCLDLASRILVCPTLEENTHGPPQNR
jgi:hypothetical protein